MTPIRCSRASAAGRRSPHQAIIAMVLGGSEPRGAAPALWLSLSDLIGSSDGRKLGVFAQGLTLDILLTETDEFLRKLRPPESRPLRPPQQPGSHGRQSGHGRRGLHCEQPFGRRRVLRLPRPRAWPLVTLRAGGAASLTSELARKPVHFVRQPVHRFTV